VKVACVQIESYDMTRAEDGLQRALEMIDEAAAGGTDLIVLPECSYPAYFLRGKDDYSRASLRSWNNVVALLGGKARDHRCHVVAGLVQSDEGHTCLLNTAVLFDPDGNILGSVAKSFLWHFDRHWFRSGTEYRVFDTSIGRIGLMICADGRMPEIARILVLQGAQVIIDPTGLVTGGGNRAMLSNPQVEYMLPVRALENGVWIVAANKVGLEADTILYCGHSCVIDPLGNKVAEGSTDREEVIFCDISLSGAPHIPVPRCPAAYRMIVEPTANQPIVRLLHEVAVPEETVARMAVLQLSDRTSAEGYLIRVGELLDTLSRQDVQFVVLPGVVPEDAHGDALQSSQTRRRLAEMSAHFGCGMAFTLTEYEGSSRYRTCFVWDCGQLLGKYRKVHQTDEGFTAGDELCVLETRYGRLGVMLDEEALLPEVPRCLMLKGADILLWPARSSSWPLRMLARTRADENKVYVLLATLVGGGAVLVNPAGTMMAAGLPDVEQATAAQVAWVNSRYKEMAPSTHVVWGRIPGAYGRLAEHKPARVSSP